MLTITTQENIQNGCCCGGELQTNLLTEYVCTRCGRQYATIPCEQINYCECHDCGETFIEETDYDGECPHCGKRNWAVINQRDATGNNATVEDEYKNTHSFKTGDRVFWNDPDEHATSGFGTITAVQHDGDDAVISVSKDDGGEVEALPHELSDSMRYDGIAIIGRIPGDDDDSCYVYENKSESEALKIFESDIYEDSTDSPCLIEKEHGVTIFHNITLVSDSPIKAI